MNALLLPSRLHCCEPQGTLSDSVSCIVKASTPQRLCSGSSSLILFIRSSSPHSFHATSCVFGSDSSVSSRNSCF